MKLRGENGRKGAVEIGGELYPALQEGHQPEDQV